MPSPDAETYVTNYSESMIPDQPSNLDAMNTSIIAGPKPGTYCLFLGDISLFCSENDLTQAFEKYGSLAEVRIKRNKLTKRNLSYGFVEFYDYHSAENAIRAMDGQVVCGRALKVRWSDPRDAERIGSSDSNMKKDSVSIYVAFTAEIPTVTINDVTLRNLFAPFGQLQDVSIKKSVMDRQSQCQRGYAFVCFPSTKQGVQMALHAATQLIDCHINGVHYHCEISNTLRSKLSPPMSMNGSPHPSTPSPVPTSGNVHPMQDVPQHPLASQQFVPVATSLPPAMAALPPSVNNATPMYMSWNQQYSSSIITNVDPAMSLQLATSPHMYLPTSAVPPVAAPPSSFAMHFPPQLPQPPLLMQPPSGMVYRSDVSPHASPPLLASYSSDASTIASTYSAPLTPLFNANNMGNGGNNGGHVPVYGFLPTVSAPATTSTGMMMMAPPMMVPAMPQYMISHPLPQQPVNQQPVSSHPSVMQVSFVPTPTYEYQHQRQHQHQQQQHQEQQQQHQEQQQQQQQQAYHHRLAY